MTESSNVPAIIFYQKGWSRIYETLSPESFNNGPADAGKIYRFLLKTHLGTLELSTVVLLLLIDFESGGFPT